MPLSIVPFPDPFAAADFTLRDRAQRDQEAARMLDYIQRAQAQKQELALRQRTETRLQHADELVDIQRRNAIAREQRDNEPFTVGDLSGLGQQTPASQLDAATGNTAPSTALPEPNRLATGALGANTQTGIATTFGLNPDGSIDREDNGVGFRGANTRNPSLIGVALHPSALLDAGIPKKQWDKTQVAVQNPATGKSIIAPVVDLLGNPKAGVDLTYGATKALGTTGKDPVRFSIVGVGDQRPRPNVSLGGDYQAPQQSQSTVPTSSTAAPGTPAAMTQATPADALTVAARQAEALRIPRRQAPQWINQRATEIDRQRRGTGAGASTHAIGDDGAMYVFHPGGQIMRNGQPIDSVPGDVKLGQRSTTNNPRYSVGSDGANYGFYPDGKVTRNGEEIEAVDEGVKFGAQGKAVDTRALTEGMTFNPDHNTYRDDNGAEWFIGGTGKLVNYQPSKKASKILFGSDGEVYPYNASGEPMKPLPEGVKIMEHQDRMHTVRIPGQGVYKANPDGTASLLIPESAKIPSSAQTQYIKDLQAAASAQSEYEAEKKAYGDQAPYKRLWGASQSSVDEKKKAADAAAEKIKVWTDQYPELEKHLKGASAPPAPPASTAPAAPPAPATSGGAATVKPLDPATAKQFLTQAGGDKEKARQLARAAGYTF